MGQWSEDRKKWARRRERGGGDRVEEKGVLAS